MKKVYILIFSLFLISILLISGCKQTVGASVKKANGMVCTTDQECKSNYCATMTGIPGRFCQTQPITSQPQSQPTNQPTIPQVLVLDKYEVYKEDETPNSIGDNLYLVEINCPRSNNYYIEDIMCMPDIRADIALIGLGIDPSSSVSSTQASCIFRADSPFKVAVHAQCTRYDTPLRREKQN